MYFFPDRVSDFCPRGRRSARSFRPSLSRGGKFSVTSAGFVSGEKPPRQSELLGVIAKARGRHSTDRCDPGRPLDSCLPAILAAISLENFNIISVETGGRHGSEQRTTVVCH